MKKTKSTKKTALKALIVILCVIIAALAALGVVFRRELSSMTSVANVKGGLYTMNCTYDYNLQELIETGVSSDQELVDWLLANLFRGVIHPSIDISQYACTTFNAVKENGDVLFGRNFDYTEAPGMLVWTDPEDGYASVSMVALEACGYTVDYLPDSFINKALTLAAPFVPVDGMNEKGLTIGVLELENGPTMQETDKIDLTTTTMIRLVLDRAATVEEAIELFRSYDMHDSVGCGYHYHITDITGKSVIIEYIDNEINLIYPQGSEGYENCLVAANYYLTEGVDDPHGCGWDRTDAVRGALKACNGVTDASGAMAMLESAKMDDCEINGYVCDTLWSAVYDPANLTVSLCANLDYETVYTYGIKP